MFFFFFLKTIADHSGKYMKIIYVVRGYVLTKKVVFFKYIGKELEIAYILSSPLSHHCVYTYVKIIFLIESEKSTFKIENG